MSEKWLVLYTLRVVLQRREHHPRFGRPLLLLLVLSNKSLLTRIQGMGAESLQCAPVCDRFKLHTLYMDTLSLFVYWNN